MSMIIFLSKGYKIKNLWNQLQRKTIIDPDINSLHKNNASIAVLFGKYSYMLRKEKFFAHLDKLYIPQNFSSLFFFCLFSLRYLIRGMIKYENTFTDVDITGYQTKYFCFTVHPKKNRLTERDFYPDQWSEMQMLKALDDLGCKYVIIRWHKDILNHKPVNDVDILIDDKDAPKLRTYLKGFLGTKPIDIYTVHGGEIGRGDNIAYFPPHISQNILENRIEMTSNCGYIPSLQDQFNTLAYHAVINKGEKSQIDIYHSNKSTGKIYKELSSLKNELNIDVNITLEALYNYLEDIHWLPPLDMMRKKSQKNIWLKAKLNNMLSYIPDIKGSYFVLILRDISYQWDIIDEFLSLLKNDGFKILFSHKLTDTQKRRASSEIRGGNWSSGPWNMSGGFPAHIIIISDEHPIKMSRKQKKAYPAVDNARILLKKQWRDYFNNNRPKEEQANFLHTSDNNLEALEYLDIIDKDMKGFLYNQK